MVSVCVCVVQGRFSVPLLDAAQTRRVVVSHNVDKALKEGEWKNHNARNANNSNNVLSISGATRKMPSVNLVIKVR